MPRPQKHTLPRTSARQTIVLNPPEIETHLGPVALSVFRASLGDRAGARSLSRALLNKAAEALDVSKKAKSILDYRVTSLGTDLYLLVTTLAETHAVEDIARATVEACAPLARGGRRVLDGQARAIVQAALRLEREREFVLLLAASDAPAYVWNDMLCRVFADPFSTRRLVTSPELSQGFRFEIIDKGAARRVFLDTPEEVYALLRLIEAAPYCQVRRVYARATGETVAIAEAQPLAGAASAATELPLLIVKTEQDLPTRAEVMASLSRRVRGRSLPRLSVAALEIANGQIDSPRDPLTSRAKESIRHRRDSPRKGKGPYAPPISPDLLADLDARWRDL